MQSTSHSYLTNVLLLKWLVCALVLVNIAFFWPGNLFFLNDDLVHIPLTDEGYFFQTKSVRPVHELLVKLDLLVWGKMACGFHVTALLLHFIVAVQLFFVSKNIAANWIGFEEKQSLIAGYWSVIFFLLYAGHAESLAWILGRTPVLSTIFLLISLQVFFSRQYTWFNIILSAVAFLTTLFTYEQSIGIPIVLALLAFVTSKDKQKRSWIMIGSLFACVLFYLVVRKSIASELVGPYEGGNLVAFNLPVLFSNAFRLATRLVLNPHFSTYIYQSLALGMLVLVAIVCFRKALKKHWGVVFVFLLTLGLMLAPILSLGITIRSYESGRYLYIPSVVLAIGMSVFLVRWISKGNNPFYASVLVVILSTYWLWGKWVAAEDYKKASTYAQQVQVNVREHFLHSNKPMVIDTLRLTIRRLPVYRLGFKTGAKWLSGVDTTKITVANYYDEFTDPAAQ